MTKTLHVACSPDGRLAADCAVMIASLVDTNRTNDLHIHLLRDERLPLDDLRALTDIATVGGARFTSHDVDDEQVAHLQYSERFPRNAWYRVLLPSILSDEARALYLDADTLVTGDLAPLSLIELDGAWVGAVTNPLYEHMVPRIQSLVGIPDRRSYFNSGVLLLDLDAWREHGVVDRTLETARTHPHFAWPDQDVLNMVLLGHRLPLHPRWNAMPAVFELPMRFLPYTMEEVKAAAADPAIVHFVGPYKPWHYRSRHPYRERYFDYLASTPYAGRAIEGHSLANGLLRRLPPSWADQVEYSTQELTRPGPVRTRLHNATRRLR
jgi:lipopolysaccharide biosynthesis glycosyltransferase